MRRRELLGGIGLLAGCATRGGPDLHAMTEADLGPLLATVRARVRQLRGRVGTPELRSFFRERGHAEDLLEQNAGALYAAATFRDLSPQLQRHPSVQAWMNREAPRMARAVFGMASFLDELTEPERATIGNALRGPGDLGGHAVATATTWAHEQDLEPEREAQLTRLLRLGRTSLTRERPSHVIDRHIARLDRLSERRGVDWRDWEALLAADSPASPSPVGAEEQPRTGVHPLVIIGLAILGVGAVFAGLGLALVAAANAATSTGLGGLGAATAAAALLALAVVIAPVGLLLLFLGLVLPRPLESSMKAFGHDAPELKVVSSSPPALPAGTEASSAVECMAEVQVDKRGRPTVVRIGSACPQELHDPAREAVMTWRWEPARASGDRGKRVHARTTVTVRFEP